MPDWTLNSKIRGCLRNKKSLVTVAAQDFSWSCYPDLNWGPHPYQRSKTNIFGQKQDKNKKFRRTIRLLRCQKNCRQGTSAPCFFIFPIGRTTSRKEMRERQRVASERRQFPRGQLSGFVSPSAGNCHGAEPTFDPALLLPSDNRPAVNRGGPPSLRHHNNATFKTKTRHSNIPKERDTVSSVTLCT